MTATYEPVTPELPAGADWTMCGGCRRLVYAARLARNLGVCPLCGHHHRVPAPERLAQLLDPDSVKAVEVAPGPADPLGFVDSRPYPQRLAEARARTGLAEAAVCARGTVEGRPCVAVVLDFRFLGGSLGASVGEVVATAAELAAAERSPLVLVTASGGARMQEGVLALLQMAKTAQALGELDAAGVLTVSIVTDPTYGGVAASFATLADVVLAEPGARLGFAGPRVIAQTIRAELPDGFQRAETLLERGLVDAVVPRSGLRAAVGRLLAVAGGAEPVEDPGPAVPDGGLVTDPAALPRPDPWQAVRAARDVRRPTTSDFVAHLVDGFQELRGDRLGGDSPAILAGVGRLDGVPVAVLGHEKGHDAAGLARHDYGMATPAGYRKSARVLRLAAKLGLPVVTLVDTPGAHPGAAAEEQGQAVAIAENLRLLAGLPVPTVAVVTGEGGSGGALALAVADRLLLRAGAVLSVISPEGCAAILWRDPAAGPAAAAALKLDARSLLELGVVDGVVPEPGPDPGDVDAAAEPLRAALTATLRQLLAEDPRARLAARRERLRTGRRA